MPLSSVHWVLGVNRQMALSEKIGQSIDLQVKAMVLNHKVGLPLSVYNAGYGTKEATVRIAKTTANLAVTAAKAVAQTVGGWFGLELFQQNLNAEAPTAEPKTTKVKADMSAWSPSFQSTSTQEPENTSVYKSESVVEQASPSIKLEFPSWPKLNKATS